MGKEKEKVSACENAPRSGSSVVRFRNVKGFLFGEWCVSYEMLWRVVFTLSASATALPASASSALPARLQKNKIGKESKEKKRLGKEKEKVSACENVPRSRSSVVRFRNVKGFFFGGEWCVSYSMLWRVVFTLSASATALPASAPSVLPARLQKNKTGKEAREKRMGKEKEKEKVSACEIVPRADQA